MNRRQRLDRDHLAGRHVGRPNDDCFGCAFDEREAYAAVAGEMYVEGEVGAQSADEVLEGLEPIVVVMAREYAKRARLPWPPFAEGPYITISSSLIN